MAWILMAGCDGFGNDAYIASSIIFTNYEQALAAGEELSKKMSGKNFKLKTFRKLVTYSLAGKKCFLCAG